MKKILFIVLFSACTAIAFAQTADQKAVEAAVETLRQAMVSGDKAALENIAADALSYGHSNGKIEDKATFVAALVKSHFIKIDLTEQTVYINDNIALVRHKLTGENNDNGTPGKVNIAVLTVWQKQKGQWKLLGRQAVKLVQPS
ncbi:nuclear transport factor 2 family protein [Chryseolinea lacunae]|uniref:Nuclear transport factor 2 family protein n=1 Tax=Chryseolinea lacunae TaxID=2801331 RepID=A0ABS1KWB5_9BACT|nr:nuclear transport factor 2 family protein [Chryseolinea lacunae]MBL0743603.1 nuclear transport factor 2 family protein [Chryseolinea lacunae]